MASSLVSSENTKNQLQYAKVAMKLENCILPTEKLAVTPSEQDGLDRNIEIELRILGCELIQTSGVLLRLPQVAMAAGQILFQRFYYSKSFIRHAMEVVAMACVTLASKIEEAPRRMRDVINVFHHIKQVRAGKTIQPLILDQNYISLKNQVIKAERRVLKELGFSVHVQHPHKIIVTMLEILKVKNQRLTQTAWNYMNDSLRSDVFLRYHPSTIACTCIYLSARVLQIPLPSKPSWFQMFDVVEEDITDICHIILSLYNMKKPDPEKLEKIVEEVKKVHQEAKLRAKGIATINNLLSNHVCFSPPSLPVSPKTEKSPMLNVKKEKEESKYKNGITSKSHKEVNHKRRRSLTPTDDNYFSDHHKRKKASTSGSSRSPSPKRKHKTTPPKSFKSSKHSEAESKMKELKKSKHKSARKAKKRSRSQSISPATSPPTKHSKKSYKSKSSKSRHSWSPSHGHEHFHHTSHEKSHKSRNKDKTLKSSHHHSKDKSRR